MRPLRVTLTPSRTIEQTNQTACMTHPHTPAFLRRWVKGVLPRAKRLVAIGDLHGDIVKTRAALRIGGLIDASDHWVGAACGFGFGFGWLAGWWWAPRSVTE